MGSLLKDFQEGSAFLSPYRENRQPHKQKKFTAKRPPGTPAPGASREALRSINKKIIVALANGYRAWSAVPRAFQEKNPELALIPIFCG